MMPSNVVSLNLDGGGRRREASARAARAQWPLSMVYPDAAHLHLLKPLLLGTRDGKSVPHCEEGGKGYGEVIS